MSQRPLALIVLASALACTPSLVPPESVEVPCAPSLVPPEAVEVPASADPREVARGVLPPDPAPVAPPPGAMGFDRAAEVLFLKGADAGVLEACRGGEGDAVRCLIEARYEGDGAARREALALYDETGTVAGIERPHTMDGGYRGMIEIVPELPVGRHRRLLTWVLAANRGYQTFFDGLQARASAPLGFRWRSLEMRFFRSVGRTTPSAYAIRWTVAFNVSGSLHRSEDAVRETLFHEVFHLNDEAHGRWSDEALGGIYEGIVERCKDGRGKPVTSCLRPFAPHGTMVRGGTFYAFQPGNDVREYAAELAIRYYREHQLILAGRRLDRPAFKCGSPENARAWSLIAGEFFAGVDLVPPCRAP